MLIIILALIISGLVYYIKEVRPGHFDWKWDGPDLFLVLFLTGVISTVVALIPSFHYDIHPPEINYELVETREIYALEDNITHGGRYFLGSGTANGDAAYFYVVEEDFGIKTKSKDTDYAYIRYTDETPTVEYYKTEFKNPLIRLLTLWGPYNVCRFNIPEGSVTTNINVDLQ